ncbi:MAG: hypothetical protein M1836_004277 [Candelina mexicana]|nr:MAG: hypothetical protein M1836_004277 [Candelina mexicana]
MDSEDDEDLKHAIALSLQDQATYESHQSTSSRHNPEQLLEITNNTQAAIEAPDHTPTANKDRPAMVCGIKGLDRKQDERNRLARKRRAAISPPAPRKRTVALAENESIVLTCSPREAPGKRLVEPTPRGSFEHTKSTDACKESLPGIDPRPDMDHHKKHQAERTVLQYPRGTLKKTWAFGHPRDEDIKIEEVLQKQSLKIAVLSAFQWDVEWLLTKLDMVETKMVFVMQAQDDATKQQYRRETSNMPNLRLCFPSMAGQISCMHSKLQLLFYKHHLRIVIPSANLVPYDWGEPGTMENTVFLIDLPRRNKEIKDVDESLTSFGQELIYFIEAMGLQDDIVQGVLKFDFAETKHLAFIHTIGGSHTGDTWRRTGYCGLGRAVKSLGLSCDGPLEVDFVTSSIGSLNDGFLQAIFLAAHGDDGMTEYNQRILRPRTVRRKDRASEGIKAGSERMLAEMRMNFRIYFPTEETVVDSSGGPDVSSFMISWWSAHGYMLIRASPEAQFVFNPNGTLRRRFREAYYATARAAGTMLFARPQSSINERCTPWAYVGSANLSESAWGRLSQDKVSKAPKLMCRNWECGVLVPIPASDVKQPVSMDSFQNIIPVPMHTPGREYGTRKPWFYTNI